MKRLKNIEAACAVIALCYASGVHEDTVLRVCSASGFCRGEGMFDDEWQEAAEDLGLELSKVKMRPMKLSSFIKKHPRGLFLVSTVDHLFCVDNGIVYDPHTKDDGTYPALGRVIQLAFRTETPIQRKNQ